MKGYIKLLISPTYRYFWIP